MRLRSRGFAILFTFIFLASVSAIFAQQQRGRRNPAPAPPSQADIRIKYRTTSSGQSYESATMIKGKRERSEMRMGQGMEIINITQCDLKRTIQVSDANRKYVITPMQTADSSNTPPPSNTASAPAAEPVRTGGVVNYITTINDTGERKEMFGFTARHIKMTLTMESSPDACSPVKQRMEIDGWYIDLTYGLDCDLGHSQMASRPVARGGCRDRVVTKQIGSGRRGYPLIETTTMYGPDGNAMFTSTKEVLDLSREPLDAALFDVPAGYTETSNSQELYAAPVASAPSMSSIMGEPSQPQSSTVSPSTSVAAAATKAPGTLRVGVVAINNRTDRSVSLDSLRQRLISGIVVRGGIDAVPLSGVSAAEIEAEAKARQVDFILYTDITTMKTSAAKKLGGFLGKAVGATGIDKTESRVDFKLFAVGETAPSLQSSSTAKEEGDEASAGASVDNEANKVSAEVRKKLRG